jgi:TRAP-type mannitol/chloroaromatic compound transport system permease large subunit
VLGAVAAFLLTILKSLGWSNIDFSSGTLIIDAGSIAAMVATAVLVLALVAALVFLLKQQVIGGAVQETVSVSAMVFGVIVAASMLSLVFRGFGGDEVVAEVLSKIPGEHWGALIAVMLVIFLLGFVLEFVEIIFIVIPIVGPVLLATDFHPVWFAVLVAMNLQTSFLTPPFGFALFYYRSVAPAHIRTVDIYLSVIPFVIIQLIAMLLVLFFPMLATWLPDVVFD